MKKSLKKGMAVFLTVAMAVGWMPGAGAVSVFAAETPETPVTLGGGTEHYDENGFCTGYEFDSNGDWVRSACTDETCTGYQPLTVNKGVYEISNAGQLYRFAGIVNGTWGTAKQDAKAVLTDDIRVNDSLEDKSSFLASLEIDEEDNVTNGDSFRKWTPIGSNGNPFYGTFDGDGHTISGLYFNDGNVDNVGLFSKVISSGSILEVHVSDSYFEGKDYVSGVCGYAINNGTITDCSNSGTVKGSDYVGGVCGQIRYSRTINGCSNLGTVKGSDQVGGVCGSNGEGIITNCYNKGSVSGKVYLGGVCGYNMGTIQNCYSAANVTLTQDTIVHIGGVCGLNTSTGTIQNCYHDSELYSGLAVGYNYTGGTVGEDVLAKDTAAFASGEVAYLLQNGQEAGDDGKTPHVWGQMLDEDTYPVLGGVKVDKEGDTYINVYDPLELDETYTAQSLKYGTWYTFTTATEGYYEFSSENKQGNIYVTVEIGKGGSISLTNQLVYKLAAGTMYYVCVEDAQGTYDLKIEKLDPTLAVGENTIKVSASDPVWYEFTPAEAGTYVFSSKKARGGIYVNTDQGTSGLQGISYSPAYELSKGEKYYVRLDCSLGTYDLKIEKLDTTLKVGENKAVKVGASEPVWYEFKPETTGVYTFSSTGTIGSILVNENKDTSGNQDFACSPAYELIAGRTYYVRINRSPDTYDLTIAKLDTTLKAGEDNTVIVSQGKIWYEFKPDADGIYVFSSTKLTGGNIFVNLDKGTDGSQGITTSPAYELSADQTYCVRIDYSFGTYDLNIKKCEHSASILTYSADDEHDTITVTCGVCKEELGTITLSAPGSLTYDGDSKEAVVTNNVTKATITTPVPTYETEDGQPLDGVPTNAGTYTASISLTDEEGTKTVSVTYTVAKAENAPNMPSDTIDVPNSYAKVSDITTLPNGWVWQEEDKDKELTVSEAVTATAVYTGEDKDNYKNLQVSVSITRSTCDHKGGTATCTKKAVCSICEKEYGDVDVTNHANKEVRDAKAATCTESGYTGDTYCTDCKKKLETGTTVKVLGHKYTSEVTKEPTTSEEGIRTYTCTRCDDIYTEPIPKKTSVPSVPSNPWVPSTPTQPDTPTDPENPDKAEDPENPEAPENPEDPDKPEDPEKPDDPKDPSNPDHPDAPENGWYQDENGDWYLYQEGDSIENEWYQKDGKWYHFDEDGVMETGWIKDEGIWYYLSLNGDMQTGWVKDEGTWYYLSTNGSMQTGWVKDKESWYYLDADGSMKTGWVKEEGKWYYLNADGSMKTGWVKEEGTWYYLNADGSMKTGWVQDKETWYYLNPDGSMKTGWVQYKGNWYYLDASGAMVTDTVVEGYRIGHDGVWVK